MDLCSTLEQNYRLAVWDSSGRMYMPVRDYSSKIVCYARARVATEVVITDYNRQVAEERKRQGLPLYGHKE